MFQILQCHIPCAAIEDCKGNGKGGSVLGEKGRVYDRSDPWSLRVGEMRVCKNNYDTK